MPRNLAIASITVMINHLETTGDTQDPHGSMARLSGKRHAI